MSRRFMLVVVVAEVSETARPADYTRRVRLPGKTTPKGAIGGEIVAVEDGEEGLKALAARLACGVWEALGAQSLLPTAKPAKEGTEAAAVREIEQQRRAEGGAEPGKDPS